MKFHLGIAAGLVGLLPLVMGLPAPIEPDLNAPRAVEANTLEEAGIRDEIEGQKARGITSPAGDYYGPFVNSHYKKKKVDEREDQKARGIASPAGDYYGPFVNSHYKKKKAEEEKKV